MVSRSSRLRTKIVALLVSLCALWAFAAWVTLRDGLNLLWVQTYDSEIYQPSEPLLLGLQAERRLAAEYLGDPSERRRAALDDSIRDNSQLARDFQTSARSWRAELAAGDELRSRVAETVSLLEGLGTTRTAVQAADLDRSDAEAAYTATIDAFFHMFDALGNLDERDIADDTAALIDLNRARELVSQQDALIAGVLAADRLTAAEYTRFVQLVGAERFLIDSTVPRLPDRDQTRYADLVDSGGHQGLRTTQERIVSTSRAGAPLPVDGTDWNSATESTLGELHTIVLAGGDDLVDRAAPVAIGVLLRLLLAAGLGMFAVIASIIMSITTARAIVAQLERLRDAAHQLAEERLPGVVERLGRGEEVDVAGEAPPLEFGNDEIGQVGRAFNRVQETAVRTAVEQAELRRSVRDVFLSLARRTQALVHRQLTLLDAMERREDDADKLEELFRVDHLATRMRRNAENLIVLSGSTPGRTWRRDVPMVDVLRGAIAEVEDYTRVTVLPVGPVALAGRTVGDVIHLLAELIENALSFSPPHTTVQVKGQLVANGYAVEIEDRGLGMSDDERDAANERVASHPEFRLSSTVRLGLFVVSRLTERTGIRIHLKESPYGGTTAVVLIPLDLIVVTADDGSGDDGSGDDGSAAHGSADDGVADAHRRSDPAPEAASTNAGHGPEPEIAAARPQRHQTIRAVASVVTASPPPAASAGPSVDTPTGSLAGPLAGSLTDTPSTAPPAARSSTYTPSGLPVRVRPTIGPPPAAAPPRPTGGLTDDTADLTGGTSRPPEQVLRMMSAYQSGTRQGRSDAARLGADPDPPDDQPADDRTGQ
ncbi:nitrate- and nitrite sensing domain-containing protein [Solwaraspora sp. WMMD406]|uniref:sensor histidine kinase n=1 Tax=Solwaraspora sp. WMMD406 TaxID=3016095 RepID=UPI0024172DED|nr:nitrate- and nitrite sensing domain-containing protein [Solwaraspora sp. WMMD406]MDG4766718.1 nitrate- and nitrite sensing domain-containing protein [Solwaraspora sp. WMMD406]